MTAEQLAQCVTERIYVDDAGYYMDAEELAGWQSEQSSAARDAELEALEAEWQARLDEAEAAAEQARAEAEERVAQAQAEADERLSRLLSRFEYLLVIVLCAAVGLVLLSVMLPLLGVLSAIGG